MNPRSAELLGEDPQPSEADKAIELIRARADAVGDMDGHTDRKSTRLNSSHIQKSRMPSSA